MARKLITVIMTAMTLVCQAQPTRQQVGPQAMPEVIAAIQAPFEMPQLQRPTFPQRKVVVKMAKKGLSTTQIQQTIEQMAAKGGGMVLSSVIPSTTFRFHSPLRLFFIFDNQLMPSATTGASTTRTTARTAIASCIGR